MHACTITFCAPGALVVEKCSYGALDSVVQHNHHHPHHQQQLVTERVAYCSPASFSCVQQTSALRWGPFNLTACRQQQKLLDPHTQLEPILRTLRGMSPLPRRRPAASNPSRPRTLHIDLVASLLRTYIQCVVWYAQRGVCIVFVHFHTLFCRTKKKTPLQHY